jgi:undecaprenyl-diphosphatase
LKSFLAFLALGLAPLVGFSRVYLGVHFPTDVVAGFFLGLASTVLMATLARNLSSLSDTPRRADLPMALVLGIGLTCAVVLGKHAAPPGLEFSAPQSRVDVRTTESLLAAMPREVRRVTGKATLPTNLMIAGDLEMVLDVLRGQNWKTVAPNAFYTREVHSPVFPAFVDEQPAGVTLQKTARDERFVLRLWKCPTTIRGANAWVGSLIREKVRRRYLGMTIYAVDPDLDLATDAFSVVIREIHPNPVDGFRQRGLYSWKHQFFTHGNALLIDATRGGKSR